MNFQVNFLKKTERRYQGVVSMKVMALGSVSVLAGITILVLTLAGISKMTLNANLSRARSEWERLDPQAQRIQGYLAGTDANRKTLERLKPWAMGEQLSMFKVLRAVQSEIPAQMALANFFAGVEEVADGSASQAARVIRLSGRSTGEMTAVEAKRRLSDDAIISDFCGDIRLVSSQRESGENWLFALEGRRFVEGGQP